MGSIKNNDLRKLSRLDQILVLIYLVYLYTRCPALPAPVHFSLVATLCMFALLPLVPLEPLSIPTAIGGGISFALLTHPKRKI
jgi:hypothetical protein